MANKPLILVDGSSYLYRAFHALPPLANTHGEPTGAVYGVVNMLRKLLKDYQPEKIAVVFDAKGKTFRDELYPAYKAHRPTMPEDLQKQIEPVHTVVRAMGLPLVMIEGVEADDVIATLAQQAVAQNIPVVISTGDKDFAQLVNGHITLVNTMSNTVLDRAAIKEKFGVMPEQIIDYLTLVGDSVDNIPGVPNVGPKTAAKWLEQYSTLDNLIANADKIIGKVGNNLRASLEQLPLTRCLVTIKQDVVLPIHFDNLIRTAVDKNTLRELFARLEFKTWLRELEESADLQPELQSIDPPERQQNYSTIFTEQELLSWLEELNKAELFSLDTETTSLDYMNAEIVGMSFAINASKAAYVPVAHDYPGAPEQLSRNFVLEKLKPLLEDEHKKKIGHHMKYDMNVLGNYAIQLNGVAFDTMMESYVLNSVSNRHDMDTVALKYLNYQTVHFEDIAGKGAKQLTFNQIALEQAAPYAAEDADITLRLHQTLWPQLKENAELANVFTQIEMPLVPILSSIERCGVLIDANLLHQQSKELAARLLELETEAYQLAGNVFNLSSPKQLQVILYDKLGLPVLEKTPTGQPSTSEAALQELALTYPLPKLILEYRSLSKLKSTYTDRLPEQINARTGRVHTSYHQAAVATGRLSSSDPNLQNIPVRTEEGRRIRQAFIAPAGYKIVAADYSQIELRIMAHLSQDPGLLNAFSKGLDIHKATAAEILDIPLDQVTPEQRRSAKAINFGLIYGMSAFGLAKQLGIPRQAAQEYMERYFARYPKVKEYMENTRQQAHTNGYVTTLFGRRLNLPEINSRNMARQKATERAAINAPLQGTAADIIKIAMINVYNAFGKNQLAARMIMQVHDELVCEVKIEQLDQTISLMKTCMTQAASLEVPLVVEVGIGNNWDQAH